MSVLTSIDLFAGCGGLALGLHHAGFQLLFALEKDPMAFETLEANLLSPNAPYQVADRWPSWLERGPHDIEAVLDDEAICAHLESLRGTVTLVCGGPPCQGFSVGGSRNGHDQRNRLPMRYLDFVNLVRPQIILMENVEGMARRFLSRPGERATSVADWLRCELGQMGYEAEFRVIDASKFGVPQTRRRLILFGVRRDSLYPWSGAGAFFEVLEAMAKPFVASKGLSTDRPVTVREAIDDLNNSELIVCPDSPKFMAGTYKEPTSIYAQLMRRGITNDVPPNSHRFSYHGDRILDFYKKVQATQPFGRLPKSFLLECGTKKDKKVLIDPDAPASTITTHPDEFIHYSVPRNISVREMARLQSFPDDFEFKGRYTINGPRRRFDVARCSQVGNAVPPLLAEALGQALVRFISMTEMQRDTIAPDVRVEDVTPPMRDQLGLFSTILTAQGAK